MPTAKTGKKTVTKTKRPARRRVVANDVAMDPIESISEEIARHQMPIETMAMHPVEPQSSICQSCNALPLGATHLVNMLLVLSFSLISVLFTALIALQQKEGEMQILREALKSAIQG